MEIENEEKRRPVMNRDGFTKSVLERYDREGGPGAGVLKQLEARRRQPASFAAAQSTQLNEKRHAATTRDVVCEGTRLLLEAKPEKQQEIFLAWQHSSCFKPTAQKAKTLEDALASPRLKNHLGVFAFQKLQEGMTA